MVCVPPYCQGTPTVHLIDTSNFIFDSNVVENSVNSNALGMDHWGRDPNNVFGNIGAPPFSDLPNLGNTVVSFVISTRASVIHATGNIVTNNTFLSDCYYQMCAGVGYFSSRGSTGYAPHNGPWTPNLYTGMMRYVMYLYFSLMQICSISTNVIIFMYITHTQYICYSV